MKVTISISISYNLVSVSNDVLKISLEKNVRHIINMGGLLTDCEDAVINGVLATVHLDAEPTVPSLDRELQILLLNACKNVRSSDPDLILSCIDDLLTAIEYRYLHAFLTWINTKSVKFCPTTLQECYGQFLHETVRLPPR